MGITRIERELLVKSIQLAISDLLDSGIRRRIHLFNIVKDEKEPSLESVLQFVDLLYEIVEKNGHKKNIGIVTSFYLDLLEDDIDMCLLPDIEFNKIILDNYNLEGFNGSFYSFKLQEEYSKKVDRVAGLKERNINYLFPKVDEKKYNLIFKQFPSRELGYFEQLICLTKY